jgi:hypothetical protein
VVGREEGEMKGGGGKEGGRQGAWKARRVEGKEEWMAKDMYRIDICLFHGVTKLEINSWS